MLLSGGVERSEAVRFVTRGQLALVSVGKENGLYILFNFWDWPLVIALCHSACSMVFSLPERGIMNKVRMASNCSHY